MTDLPPMPADLIAKMKGLRPQPFAKLPDEGQGKVFEYTYDPRTGEHIPVQINA